MRETRSGAADAAASPPRPARSRFDRASIAATLDLLARGTVVYWLPLLMVVANKSALPSLVAAALFCVAAAWVRTGSLAGAVRRLAPSPSPGLTFALLFVALAAVSLLWTISPRDTIHAGGEALLAVGAGVVVARGLADYPRALLLRHLSISLALCAGLALLELSLQMPLRRLIGSRLQTPQYNRAIEVLIAYSAIALGAAAFWRSARTRFAWPAMALVALATLASDSGAGVLALLAALAALAVGGWRADLARRLAAAVAFACLLTAPFIGSWLNDFAPGRLRAAMENAHMDERIAIWRVYDAVVARHILLGTGFGSSSAVAESSFLGVAPLDLRAVEATHPHHMLLQIWVELGAAGAALAGGLLFAFFWRLRARPREPQISSLMLFAALAAVAIVSHGAWQGWWLASAGAAIALQSLATREPQPSF